MKKGLMILSVFLIICLSLISAKWFTGDATSPDPGTATTTNSNAGTEGVTLQRGDVNVDGKVDENDVAFLVNYFFTGGAAPNPLELADLNGDETVAPVDLTYLINYIYHSGAAPVPLSDIPETEYIRGDLNNDGNIGPEDLNLLVGYLHRNDTLSTPIEVADVNADGKVDDVDINYLVSFLYKGGSAPVPMGEKVNSSCTDSDGGKDYYIKGRTYDPTHNGDYTDTCTNKDSINSSGGWSPTQEGSVLVEYSCGENNYGYEYYECSNGCLNGSCIKVSSNISIKRGDLDGDGNVDASDLGFFVNYLYRDGTAPDPLDRADVNNDGKVDESDFNYLVDYLFKGGPVPVPYETEKPASCTDSDGGLDYSRKGKVATEGDEMNDICVSGDQEVESCTENCFVKENYCFGQQAGNMQIKCDGACSDGVCVDAVPKDRCAGAKISRGDINKDGKLDSLDLNLIVNFIFKGGSSPEPFELGDVNNDGNVNSNDLAYLVNYFDRGGPAPVGEGINGLPISTRVRVNDGGVVKFCDPTSLSLVETKETGTSCANDFECSSNACLDGECVSIKEELEKQSTLMKKIWCWITNIGNKSGFNSCLGTTSSDENPAESSGTPSGSSS